MHRYMPCDKEDETIVIYSELVMRLPAFGAATAVIGVGGLDSAETGPRLPAINHQAHRASTFTSDPYPFVSNQGTLHPLRAATRSLDCRTFPLLLVLASHHKYLITHPVTTLIELSP